jgi:hypothetical protein
MKCAGRVFTTCALGAVDAAAACSLLPDERTGYVSLYLTSTAAAGVQLLTGDRLTKCSSVAAAHNHQMQVLQPTW